MKTNDLKKGDRVRLANGWEAEIMDNLKGNIRLAKVYGFETEIGSIYSHDIVEYCGITKLWTPERGITEIKVWQPIEHTPAQNKLRKQVQEMFK